MVANSIMDTFIAGGGSKQAIKDARKIAQQYLGDRVDSHKVYDTDTEAVVYAIGHCHIDTCCGHSQRRSARSPGLGQTNVI